MQPNYSRPRNLLIFFVLLFSYCKEKPSGLSNKLAAGSEQDFIDLSLRLEKLTMAPDGSFSFIAQHTLEGRNIGFQIELSNKWKVTKLGESGSKAYFGVGKFMSLGDETEKFIDTMAKLYQVKRKPTKTTIVPIEMVGLVDDPRQINHKPVKMKFFFNSNNDRLSSEVYINVDNERKVVEFHEKDQAYRQQLIDSLAGWH
jgi:hypothetical protein